MEKTLHPTYGTSIYIGEFPLETIYGTFRAVTFQDLITKGYVLALIYGSLESDELYTRIHSSCVTSETLGSMDCDCVQQLEGAIKKISESGHGIFFYLIQEGRGVGYVAKSRGCMNEQYGFEEKTNIDTFGAYEMMGLKHDYRDYRNVRDILHVLNLEHKKFVLLTNNPDKISSFNELKLNLARIESIEFDPNPFNASYLKSKETFGHLLYKTKKKIQSEYIIPYKRVVPFEPYALENYKRFIHVSSYFLPIRPIKNQIILRKSVLDEFVASSPKEDQNFSTQHLYDDSYLVSILDEKLIEKYKKFFLQPHWFKANVFYDLGTSQDIIVLTHGQLIDKSISVNVKPLVCIHSESLSNRFPLKNLKYKTRFRKSINDIACRGSGLILLTYNDGRGSGLAHFVLNTLKSNHGIQEDMRDYYAVCQLLKTYLKDEEFDIFCGSVVWRNLQPFINSFGLNVSSYFPPDDEGDLNCDETSSSKDNGHESITNRIKDLKNQLIRSSDYLNEWKNFFLNLDPKKKYLTTGIGTSEIHAMYLSHLCPMIKFCFCGQLIEENVEFDHLIVFSQGLTPNIEQFTARYDLSKMVFITTVNENYSKLDRKTRYLRFLEKEAKFINYREEEPDNTLIRITGPAVVFYLIYSSLKGKLPDLKFPIPSYDFLQKIPICNSFVLVVPSKIKYLCENLRSKFFEGIFTNDLLITDGLSFAHGPFQYAMTNKSNLIICGKEMKYLEKIVKQSHLVFDFVEANDDESLVVDLEFYFDFLIYNLLLRKNSDQKEWQGKDLQSIAYEVGA